MIELGSSIISSTIATVLLYPAERVKIEMQLSTVQDQQSQPLDPENQALNQTRFQRTPDSRQQPSKKDKKFSKYDRQLTSSQIESLIEKQIDQQKKMCRFPEQTSSTKIFEKKPKVTLTDSIAKIYAKHGWTGFYTGLESLVIGNGLSYGVYFVVYEKCKNYLGFDGGSVLDTIKCSGIAGIGATLATNPFWVLQTKQTQKKGSLLEKGKQLIATEGLMALWKGLSSSLILVSNPIIQFVIYEQLKKTLSIDKSSGWYDLVIFLMGALSKMISTLCTYPITVVRTKQHISVGKDKWSKIVKTIVRNEGFKGLFKGIEPKLFQTVLNSALLLMLFERIKQILLTYFAKSG